MAFCHFVVGGVLSTATVIPGGVDGNPNVPMLLTGSPAYAVIAFCYLLIIAYALTLAPVCWIYAAEVWSLETRAVDESLFDPTSQYMLLTAFSRMSIAAEGNWIFNFVRAVKCCYHESCH